MRKRGLREQIAGATSEEEVAALLKEGSAYQVASARTRRSWKFTANRKFGSFAAPTPVEVKQTEKKKKKAKKVVAPVA